MDNTIWVGGHLSLFRPMTAALQIHVQQLVTQLRPVAEALDHIGIPWAALPFAVGLPLLRLVLDRTLFQVSHLDLLLLTWME